MEKMSYQNQAYQQSGAGVPPTQLSVLVDLCERLSKHDAFLNELNMRLQQAMNRIFGEAIENTNKQGIDKLRPGGQIGQAFSMLENIERTAMSIAAAVTRTEGL